MSKWFEHKRFINKDRTPQVCQITAMVGSEVYYRVYDGDPADDRFSKMKAPLSKFAQMAVGRYVKPPAMPVGSA